MSKLLLTGLLVLVPSQLFPATVSLHASNVGITTLNVSIVGTNINLEEIWTATGPGFLLFDELAEGVNYTVTKTITNNTGTTWNRLANELLDPSGQGEDALDVLPYPAFVPAGFTTSNDTDGLSFAQGSGLPRTSSVFPNLVVDELADTRDFLDFFGANWANGQTGTITFGLRLNSDAQQPFLLSQRPNEESRVVIPEPSSMLLLGCGLAAIALIRNRRSNSAQ